MANWNYSGTSAQFVFDAKDDYNWKSIELDNLGADQLGHQMINGGGLDYVDGTNDYDNVPSVGGSVWVRVTSDGSTLTVREAATQGGLDTIDPCYTSTHFLLSGGQIGFADFDGGEVSDVTIKSYSTTTSSFSVTEAVENFALDSSFNGVSTLAYDNNGNLLYEGLQRYTYDAWNRLKTLAHCYQDKDHSGQPFERLIYDAAGRRIVKEIGDTSDGLRSTGMMDCTFHDYYSGQSVIEERNGSNQSIKDHVWGLTYVDEAVQTRVNTNPTGTASWTSYWLCQDANYNVLGIVNAAGTLTERYEYSAYGQRQVFVSSGSSDPGCYAPTSMSTHVVTSGSVVEPWGINEIGHQGLMHDEEIGLVYNRARMLNPALGKFMQEDPMGYVDGFNQYELLRDSPIFLTDPMGFASQDVDEGKLEWDLKSISKQQAHFTMKFTPDKNKCTCKHISFIQVVIKNTIDGKKAFPTKNTDYFKQFGTDAGAWVDHLKGEVDPYYGAEYYKDVWIPEPGANLGTGRLGLPASMEDDPIRVRDGKEKTVAFETFAICIDTGAKIGGVTWGVSAPADANKDLQLNGPTFQATPSDEWTKAVDKWNAVASQNKGWFTFP